MNHSHNFPSRINTQVILFEETTKFLRDLVLFSIMLWEGGYSKKKDSMEKDYLKYFKRANLYSFFEGISFLSII